MDRDKEEKLIGEAIRARRRAYAPYSGYAVGAAVLTADGRIFGGCNIENASYGASNCAERTAVFKAVSEGAAGIEAIAVIGGPAAYGDEVPEEATPCGICRQVIREFTDPAACEVIIAKSLTNYRKTTLEKLLPESFGPEKLQRQNTQRNT
ncbi:MAG: cytidine deaminase [Lachnospiraceae bacterium]|nr:cytidine deaminase [Lachnospiraceae bacterium]